MPTWQRFRTALKNRNAALRGRERDASVRAWNSTLVESAESLHRFRSDYLRQLEPEVLDLAGRLLPDLPVRLEFRRGWPNQKSLEECLLEGLQQDRRVGHTRFGPHRADLEVSTGQKRAAGRVSRGQQKMLATVLVLAEVRALAASGRRTGILLVDDLPSELDQGNQSRLLDVLLDTPAQLWMTGIEPIRLPSAPAKTWKEYAIEAGIVRQVVY